MPELNREQIKAMGLKAKDVRRIERAYCVLADFEGEIIEAMGGGGNHSHAFSDVCNGLRKIADGWEEQVAR